MKKKNRKTSEFWKDIGATVGGHSGEETEQLVKNLQVEYHKVHQLHVSGCDTSSPPALRNSVRLFQLFENYYLLFYPQGGSAAPLFVMTEDSVKPVYVQFFNIHPVLSLKDIAAGNVVLLSLHMSVPHP